YFAHTLFVAAPCMFVCVQAECGIRCDLVTGVPTFSLPISVDPGGVAVWKGGGDRRNVSGLDDTLGSTAVTPRKILDALAGAANRSEEASCRERREDQVMGG